MESSFALLQKNVLDRQAWRTREEPRIAIVTWIERTYHRRRRQDRLGRLTPIEFETIMTTAVELAAQPLSPDRAAVPLARLMVSEQLVAPRALLAAWLDSATSTRRAYPRFVPACLVPARNMSIKATEDPICTRTPWRRHCANRVYPRTRE